jgi:hypothetical protein
MNDNNGVDGLPALAKTVIDKLDRDGFVEFSSEGNLEEDVNALAKYASEREDVMFYFVRPGKEVQKIRWGSPEIMPDEEEKEAVYNVPGYGIYTVEEMVGSDDHLFVMREF